MTWLAKLLAISCLPLVTASCGPCRSGDDEEVSRCLQHLPRTTSLGVQAYLQYVQKHRIYVSLTTSPKRIKYLRLVLDTLDLEQVEKIYVAIPQKYRDKEEYGIPEYLKLWPKLEFIRTEKDLGPIMKLLPAMEKIQANEDPEAILVVFDDDVGHFPGVIAKLVEMAVSENSVVGGCGFDVSHWGIERAVYWPQKEQLVGLNRDVLEGRCGIAYQVKFVSVARMLELSQTGADKACKTSDDIIINYVLAEQSISRKIISPNFIDTIRHYNYGQQEDALHKGSGYAKTNYENSDRYQCCLKNISEGSR